MSYQFDWPSVLLGQPGFPVKVTGPYSGDYNKLVSQWNRMGINTAFACTELASDSAFRSVLKENNIVYPNPARTDLYFRNMKGRALIILNIL